MARRAAEVNVRAVLIFPSVMLLLLWRAAFPPASRLSEHLCVLLFQMICLSGTLDRIYKEVSRERSYL